MTDSCAICGTALTCVDADPNADGVWLAECQLGHIVEITDQELDVPVRLLSLILLVCFLLAAWIEVPV